MFSKPTITTRNDNITRKDVKSVLGSGSGLAGAVPEPKLVSEPPGATPEEKPTTVSETDTPSAARLIVGPDVKLKGAEILDCDTLVVEGRVEATMDSRVIRIADAWLKERTAKATIFGVAGSAAARSSSTCPATCSKRWSPVCPTRSRPWRSGATTTSAPAARASSRNSINTTLCPS